MNKLIYEGNAIYELTNTKNPIGIQIDIFHSELDMYWTNRGSISTSTVNTGNGIIFHDHFENKTIELNYAQLFELKTALKELFDE